MNSSTESAFGQHILSFVIITLAVITEMKQTLNSLV